VNGLLYLADFYSNNVTVINGATNSVVGSIPVGVNPFGVAYDSVNGDLYVSNEGGNNVSVIEAATSAPVASIPIASGPMGVAFDSSNGDVYVANSESNAATIIDPTTNKVVGSIPVGSSPWDIIYDSSNGNIYTTNEGSNNVSVIDGSSNLVVANVPTGGTPTSICFQAGSNSLYVANPDSNSVTVFSSSTNSPVTTVATSRPYPRGVVCDPEDGLTYVMDEQAGIVDMINDTTNALVGNFPVGTNPNYGILDTLNGYLYITDLLEYEVYVIAPSGLPETLTSVSISPSHANVTVNGIQMFTATPTCTSTCPSGATYSWGLTNSAMGTITGTGASVTFTAGNTAGTVTLLVNATLNGKTVQSSPVAITIQASSPSQNTGFLGLSGDLGYVVLGVIVGVIVVAAAAVLLLVRRKKS
jgi:YVTN family beta-propeller protein